MRSPLVMVLALQLATTGLGSGIGDAHASAPPSSPSATPPASGSSAKELYEEGRKAYRLGRFETAVQKWEEAYALSERPLLLYNIALAYRRLYDLSQDVKHLRRAHAVMLNFIKLAEADPSVELDDARERLAEFEVLMTNAREQVEQEETPAIDPVVPPPIVTEDPNAQDDRQKSVPPPRPVTRPVPSGSDEGRALRIGGITTMAVGGAVLATGIGLGIFYALRGRRFSRAIRSDLQTFQDECRSGADPAADCEQLEEDIEAARTQGRAANRNAYISTGVAGGLGAIGLVIGGALYAVGKKRQRPDQSAKVIPYMGMDGFGLTGTF